MEIVFEVAAMNDMIPTTDTIDSREIAEMIDIRHSDLLRKIDNYNKIILNAKLRSVDYFQEGSYIDDSGKTNKCYLLTKMGCEFVANKFTGEKGVIFTAKYVKRFNDMEHQHTCQQVVMSIEDVLIQSLQEMKSVKSKIAEQGRAIEAAHSEINEIKSILTYEPKEWRHWVTKSISKIAESESAKAEFGDSRYQAIRQLSYEKLESRAACKIKTRVKNLKERLRKDGATKTRINSANAMDIIEGDIRLKEIYTSIIQEMAISY